MKISEIKDILKARVLGGEDRMDRVVVAGGEDTVRLHVAAGRQGENAARGVCSDGPIFRNPADGDRLFPVCGLRTTLHEWHQGAGRFLVNTAGDGIWRN